MLFIRGATPHFFGGIYFRRLFFNICVQLDCFYYEQGSGLVWLFDECGYFLPFLPNIKRAFRLHNNFLWGEAFLDKNYK